jgi:polyferredoxin
MELAFRKYIWFLVPLIAIGGMFYPILGLLMLPMMIGLIVMSYSKARYWCANMCPRGSFLDHVIRPFSGFSKGPGFLISAKFKYVFMILFLALFLFRMYSVITEFSGWIILEKVGFVFASVCLITTVAATILGIFYSPRTWCTFCPMGTLQTEIHRAGKSNRPSAL